MAEQAKKEAAQEGRMEVNVEEMRAWLRQRMSEHHRTTGDIAHSLMCSRPMVSRFLRSELPEEYMRSMAAKVKKYKELLEELEAEFAATTWEDAPTAQ